jgi:Fe-S oxidoreductase
MAPDHPAAYDYFNISGQQLAWAIFIIGTSAFCFTILRRIHLMVSGSPDPRFRNAGQRALFLIKDGFFQIRQPRYPMAGIVHIAIFWGFLVLGLHSVELIISGLWPGLEMSFLNGLSRALYNSVKDVFVLIVLLSCFVAVYVRAVIKPERYSESNRFEAYLVLFLIISLMITDMFYQGGILISGHTEPGVPIAAFLARPFLKVLGADSLATVTRMSYWIHLIIFFFFLNLLPLSKHFHIITALPNVFFRRIGNGELKPPRWDDFEMENQENVGVKVFTDFTWKHILDFFTCTECGRCTDNCPANAAGRPLSPKKVIMDIRDFGYRSSTLFSKKTEDTAGIPGQVVPDETFWSCTTCGSCEAECPVYIEHIDKIIELRRRRVLMESRFPSEIEQIYRNIEIYGDAWGMGSALRTDWARGLNIHTVKEDSNIDILYWVGCAGAFDTRSQMVAVAFSKILKAAGMKFGILGEEEECCGDYARRTGNEYLFQMLAQKNIQTFEKYGIRKIVTTCPHGYNTLKNEYARFGGKFEVIHAADFMLDMLVAGELKVTGEFCKTVAWHDPCYLGRHNGIYEAPRKILSQFLKATVADTIKSKDRSFCCGAGGGHFWMESSGRRINDIRVEQLLESYPDILATGCPYCLVMLEDGLESKAMKAKIPVKDIVEMVAEVLE